MAPSARVTLQVMLRAVLLRPRLWLVALRQALRMAPARWWRHRPFLPLPDPAYLTFRMETQYGPASGTPRSEDVVSYLEWCREEARAGRHRRPQARR